MEFHSLILIAGLLVLFSALSSKLSERIGVPALLIFLGIGMLAGSDALGLVYFDDARLANAVGTIALAYILYSGGFDTRWSVVRPVFGRGLLLSTVGVVLTTGVLGLAIWFLFGFNLIGSLLLASIVSSTDAAAVFSILRSRGVSLKGRLRPLLELESGSNDPMAVFLTLGFLDILMNPEMPWFSLIPRFAMQMLLGAGIGLGLGRGSALLLNRVRLDYDGLYPVLSFSLVPIVFGLAAITGGNGFLAVYLAGIVVGNSEIRHRRSLMRFHDGLGWLMQIGVFLTLGLLVFPSHLVAVAGMGLLVAAILVFLARPLAVYLCLLGSEFTWFERTLVGWTGLRGAVPVVLATFPLMAGYPESEHAFNVVFFVVCVSVLLQGRSLMLVARWLRVDEPLDTRPPYPLEFDRVEGLRGDTREYEVLPDSPAAGRRIMDLGLPANVLVLLVRRGHEFLVPSGQTSLLGRDTLLVLAEPEAHAAAAAMFAPRDSIPAPAVGSPTDPRR
ncbi:MAG: potassium/proton antiporter [Candidatus Krumholzibacteria bacterium]|jgi:cell volume regulation protein A|nr:potassium/proton antiporter [Candidatus Krumholzibacteria bacterium]